jgi:hypothetical protein
MISTSEQLLFDINANEQQRFRNLSSATKVAEFFLQKFVWVEGGYNVQPISRVEAYDMLPHFDWLSMMQRRQDLSNGQSVPAIKPDAFGVSPEQFEQVYRTIESIALDEMYRP